MTYHGANDASDHTTACAESSLRVGTRMRLVEICDPNSGARAGKRANHAARRAASAPLPRRWRLRGASGDRDGDAKRDSGYEVTARGRFRSRQSGLH